MADGERRNQDGRAVSERTVYEPRVATRRIRNALLALGIITAVGVLGYIMFEAWSFTDALYMTVVTLSTVGYREVRPLDTTRRLWTMLLLITGVGTLFYVAVTSVELVVEGTIRGYQAEPKHYIVARASFDESAAKLEIAGADRTLSPYAVGGRRFASLATQLLGRGLPRHRDSRRGGDRVHARGVQRVGGLVHRRPDHRRAPYRERTGP